MKRAFGFVLWQALDLARYAWYRLRRRARLKDARKKDPNIYPLW